MNFTENVKIIKKKRNAKDSIPKSKEINRKPINFFHHGFFIEVINIKNYH